MTRATTAARPARGLRLLEDMSVEFNLDRRRLYSGGQIRAGGHLPVCRSRFCSPSLIRKVGNEKNRLDRNFDGNHSNRNVASDKRDQAVRNADIGPGEH